MPLPPVPDFHPIANPKAVVSAANVRFTVLTERLIRIEYSKDERFEDRPSQAFWHRDLPLPKFKKTVSKTSVEIETEFLHLKYRVNRLGFTPRSLTITLKQSGVTWRYGMPQLGNLKGTARTLDGIGGSLRLEPGLISKKGWAVMDDSKSLVFDEKGWLEPRGTHQKDLYFFGHGQDVEACLFDFTLVAGKIPMIPRYILGNWWSRFWAYTDNELKALMQDFREHEVPLSVCIVDMDWHIRSTGNESNGWTGYTWNRELFPDPNKFIQWLHEQGLRTALNLHPAQGVYPHEQQYKQMAEWMGHDPNDTKPIKFDSADPRFMEGYFDILHRPYEADGVDFWWIDWQQGKKSKLSGLDPLWLLNHMHHQDLGRDGKKRPFIFSRWGGLGNHRYPIGFSGDTIILWSALAYQPYFTATAANVGYSWWSHDIGGHMFKDLTPELYLRWVQFGVFSPILRLHSTAKPELDRRPWGKPERYFKASRDAMQLRHALIPYIYSMAWRAHQTGISLVTPMYYGNMDSPAAFAARDQYFFGSELFAAPVIAPVRADSGFAEKRIWFPPGTWTQFFSGERVRGGGWRTVQAALEDIPVYAKAGAIVPLAPKAGWGGIENPAELDLYVFPGVYNSFDLFEDDGETVNYQQGGYAITRFSLSGDEFTIHPVQGDRSLVPAERTYRIHLRGLAAVISASLPAQYDSATRTHHFEQVTLKPNESFTLRFKKEMADDSDE